jgi:hypothetical protein
VFNHPGSLHFAVLDVKLGGIQSDGEPNWPTAASTATVGCGRLVEAGRALLARLLDALLAAGDAVTSLRSRAFFQPVARFDAIVGALVAKGQACVHLLYVSDARVLTGSPAATVSGARPRRGKVPARHAGDLFAALLRLRSAVTYRAVRAAYIMAGDCLSGDLWAVVARAAAIRLAVT